MFNDLVAKISLIIKQALEFLVELSIIAGSFLLSDSAL